MIGSTARVVTLCSRQAPITRIRHETEIDQVVLQVLVFLSLLKAR